MWLLPRTDAENGTPCYCDQSAAGKMTHIWLDDNKWQILQREHSNGPDNLLASLPYAGGFPLPSDKWTLEQVLGNGGALSVHIWTWPQYEAKQNKDATVEPKFKQLSEQIRELKVTMQQDVADVKQKVATWEADRGMLHESVTNLSDMVANLKRRQDSRDSELSAMREQIQRAHKEESPVPQKKKRCLCDERSRAVTRRDVLLADTPVLLLHNGKLENRVISSRAARGGYWLETGKHGSRTWASEKHLYIRQRCRACHKAMAVS